MTSPELTSGVDFWSRGHFWMAVMHDPVKCDAYIFIQSGVINIFSKIQDGGRRHLGFSGYVNLKFRRVDTAVFKRCTKFGSNISCYSYSDRRFRRSFDDVTRINFRFRLLVMLSSPYGRDASSRKVWCIYLYPVRSY